MMKQISLGLVLLGCLFLLTGPILAQQMTAEDELSYSASMCSAQAGSSFEWLVWGLVGWQNLHEEYYIHLVCPVPLDRTAVTDSGDFGRIHIDVDVYDGNNRDEVKVHLYGIAIFSDHRDPQTFDYGEFFTSNNGIGYSTIPVEPDTSINSDIRYLWLDIYVPAEANNRKSSVIGYSVDRMEFD